MKPNTYPRALYTSIIDEIDPKLVDFYDEHVKKQHFNESFYNFASGILTGAIGDRVRKDDISAFYSNLKRQTLKKKKRWYASLQTNVEQVPETSKQYPFPDLVAKRDVLGKDEWNKLYDKTFNEVVAEKVEQTKEWSRDNRAYFIDYPGLASLTKNKVKQALESDVLRNEMEIIDRKYGMELGEAFQAYVEEMGTAIFSDSKTKKELKPGEVLTDTVPLDETDTEALLVTITGNSSAVMVSSNLDILDQKLMFYIFNRALTENVDGQFVDIPYTDLAKTIAKNHPSAKHYAEAEERCYKIANYSYEPINRETGKRLGVINFISAAIPKESEDGTKYMSISLGPVVTDALLNNQLKRFPNYEYKQLDGNVAQLLFIHIQRERIKAYKRFIAGTESECATTFQYNDFLRWVNLTSRSNKRKMITTIRTALEEYREKGIMVDYVEMDNRDMSIRIHFLPLSKDEEADLTLLGFAPIEDDSVVATRS